MTEEEAQAATLADVPRETAVRLLTYVELLRAACDRQNLISRSTLDDVWVRHIADGAQLVKLAPADGLWVDIGSGAGLPGMVVGILTERPVLLIEPRRLRAEFLRQVVDVLGLGERVEVRQARAEAVAEVGAVISARAVAPLERLFAIGQRLAGPETVWVLPKGRNAAAEVASARRMWHAELTMVPSTTDSDAAIIVASGVTPRRT